MRSVRGQALILVAFFVPLAIYLLVLGSINRRAHPVVVSGTWDFLGILFAASGFLLFGGPAVLSSLHERWRLFWLWGQVSWLREQGGGDLWALLAVLYFAGVVAGVVLLLRRQRSLTAIYNVEPAQVDYLLGAACEHLGLEPVRSGNLYVFGLSLGLPAPVPSGGLQGPHRLPATGPGPAGEMPTPAVELAGQTAILELEVFAPLRHVTLRWDPHDSPLRGTLEAELTRRLAGLRAPDHEAAAWLTLTGTFLLGASLLAGLALYLRAVLMR
jgi:hypothetical protein